MAAKLATAAHDTQEPMAQKSASKKRFAKKAVPKKRAKKTTAKRAKKASAKKSIAKKKRPAKKVAKKADAKKSAPKKRKIKPVAQVTKAQAIRDAANDLGKKARPKDIIAALAAKGITVVSAQVSMTLKAAGLRRGRRRKKVVTEVAASNGKAHGLNIEDLMLVKNLADQIGGTQRVKELASALERLL